MSERRLLFMMKPEQLEAFLRLQRAAESGDGAAACRLGDMYHEGLGGLRYSPKQTYRWYAKQCAGGRCERAEQPGRLLRARARLRAVVRQGGQVVPVGGGAGAGVRVVESRLLLLAGAWGRDGPG